MIDKKHLETLYKRGQSMQDIADKFKCSPNKVKYWMDKHGIKTRTISDAIYLMHNPNGDPFKVNAPKDLETAWLFGLGLGLYWGEGTKANKNSVRLGNSDPALIGLFIKFLEVLYGVSKRDLRFGLQLFSDTNPTEALSFWVKILKVRRSQFQKVVITPSRGDGTYRKKVKYGVLTVYYHNKKLRDIICSELKKMGFCD